MCACHLSLKLSLPTHKAVWQIVETFIRKMIEKLPEELQPDSSFIALAMLVMCHCAPGSQFRQRYHREGAQLCYDTFFAASLFFASTPLFLSDPAFRSDQLLDIANHYQHATSVDGTGIRVSATNILLWARRFCLLGGSLQDLVVDRARARDALEVIEANVQQAYEEARCEAPEMRDYARFPATSQLRRLFAARPWARLFDVLNGMLHEEMPMWPVLAQYLWPSPADAFARARVRLHHDHGQDGRLRLHEWAVDCSTSTMWARPEETLQSAPTTFQSLPHLALGWYHTPGAISPSQQTHTPADTVQSPLPPYNSPATRVLHAVSVRHRSPPPPYSSNASTPLFFGSSFFA